MKTSMTVLTTTRTNTSERPSALPRVPRPRRSGRRCGLRCDPVALVSGPGDDITDCRKCGVELEMDEVYVCHDCADELGDHCFDTDFDGDDE